MQVTVERPQPSEAVLNIEVDEQQMDQARERAYREISKYVNVPGFRPGKAPRALVEQAVGREAVEDRARELVVSIAYRAALQQEQLNQYDQGVVDEVSEDPEKPVSFTARVPLRPEVELGDYSQLSAQRQTVPIVDEDVDREIQTMLARRARVEPATEPATDDDVVFADMDTTVEGEPVGETRSGTFQIGENMAEIDAALRGAGAGDTRECDVEYPADYPDQNFAGKTVHFTFRVNHVLTKRAPELNDAWVQENTDTDSVEALREGVRRALEQNAERAIEQNLREQLLGQIVDRSTIHFPSMLVDQEVADDLRNLSASLEERGSNLERYLQQSNRTMQELQDEMATSATRHIRNGLTLGKLAEVEKLFLTKDDVEAEIKRIAAQSGMKVGEARRRLRDEGQMPSLEDRLLQEKLFTFLKERAEIQDAGAAPAE